MPKWVNNCTNAMFFPFIKALEEAKDISLYLKTLERPIDDLENADFSEVKPRLASLMHTVCLVWTNSKYYNTPDRVIVLLQEICNLLIQQVDTYSLQSVKWTI